MKTESGIADTFPMELFILLPEHKTGNSNPFELFFYNGKIVVKDL